MTVLTVRLPKSVHQKVWSLALRDEISVTQFIAAAVSEKMASGMTLDFLLDMMTPSAHWALDPADLKGRHCIHGDIDSGDRHIGA